MHRNLLGAVLLVTTAFASGCITATDAGADVGDDVLPATEAVPSCLGARFRVLFDWAVPQASAGTMTTQLLVPDGIDRLVLRIVHAQPAAGHARATLTGPDGVVTTVESYGYWDHGTGDGPIGANKAGRDAPPAGTYTIEWEGHGPFAESSVRVVALCA
jgi:hypothetical protein